MRHTLYIILLIIIFPTTNLFAQEYYDIAPLDRATVGCSRWASSIQRNSNIIYDITKTSPATASTKTKVNKKAKNQIAIVNYNVSAKSTTNRYTPNEVLQDGFTVSLWVMPFANTADSHGYVLYPIKGYYANGIMQSQWGLTVGKDYIRVYEKYINERPLLEYRHNKKEDFFITLTCQNSTPALYVDGELVSTGIQSIYSPHPALGNSSLCPQSLKFIGKTTNQHFFPFVLTNTDIRGLYKTEYTQLHSTK